MQTRQTHFLAALIACWFAAMGALAETPAPPSREDIVSRFRAGVMRLNAQYWSPTLGIWLDRPGDDLRAHYEGRFNPPWWPSANGVEVLIDFMNATGTADYQGSIESLYDLQKDAPTRRARLVAELKRRGQWSEDDERKLQRRRERQSGTTHSEGGYYSDFQNEYLDDSGWWGIAWLKMYDRTGAAKYLATARTIHAHMAKNWKPEKGGGVLWCEDEDKQKPNAITNNLFLILSARIYTRTGEKPYQDWALKTLEWIRATKLFDGSGVVDAPGHQGDYWSYNQGTFLGALTALYEATGRKEYLEEAAATCDAILRTSGLTLPSGVLVEKLGTEGDACLFKGIFARYLAQVRDVLGAQKTHPEIRKVIADSIRSSVVSMIQHGVGTDGLFRAEWHEGAKDQKTNFNTQLSGLATLVAILPDAAAASSDPARFGTRAREVTAYIQQTFWNSKTGLYAKSTTEADPDFMWGNGVMFSALVAATRHEPDVYRPVMLKFFDAMEAYWDSKAKVPGYEPAPTPGGGNDKYYDDNAWMVLTFLEAYRLTGDRRLLERSAQTLDFVLSGWDDRLGGGIWWHEGHKEGTKNTCANAPAAVACLELAKFRDPETAERLRRKAREIVEWTVKTFQDSDGLFWDSINVETGAMNRAKLTYNSALMLRAFLGLHQVTNDPTQLAEAKGIGKAGDALIGRRRNAYRDHVKWSHLMVEADLELYRVTRDPNLMARASGTADAHYERWKSNKPTDLISHAAIARELWLLADVEKERIASVDTPEPE
jgi:predicted alpha-1,6-mannanase (GH76 family)